MAQLKRAKFGDVDVDFVLGVGGYDLDRSHNLAASVFSCLLHIVPLV